MTFAEWLRLAIEEKGEPVVRFSEAAGLEFRTVYRWLNGQVIPRGYHRATLAKALGISRIELEQRIRDSGRIAA